MQSVLDKVLFTERCRYISRIHKHIHIPWSANAFLYITKSWNILNYGGEEPVNASRIPWHPPLLPLPIESMNCQLISLLATPSRWLWWTMTTLQQTTSWVRPQWTWRAGTSLSIEHCVDSQRPSLLCELHEGRLHLYLMPVEQWGRLLYLMPYREEPL